MTVAKRGGYPGTFKDTSEGRVVVECGFFFFFFSPPFNPISPFLSEANFSEMPRENEAAANVPALAKAGTIG
jgi:hypothetical protein